MHWDMRIQKIKASRIEINTGQIEGVPSNPRDWTVRELEKLRKSLKETPELLGMRQPIVVKQGDRYVAIGGNMRVCALKEEGVPEIECIVLPENIGAQKIKEIIIKDNASMGAWDVDSLVRDWAGYDLEGFGIPADIIPEGTFSGSGAGSSSGGGSDGSGGVPVDDRVLIEIGFTPEEFSFVNNRLRDLGDTPEDAVYKALGL